MITQLPLHYSLVQLRKITPDDRSMQALVSIAPQVHQLSFPQQEYLHFALGKCYDDIGEYSKAFEHFEKGCKLKRSTLTYSTEDQIQQINRIIKCFTNEKIDALRQSANHLAVPIFILGMPRSGTTLIEQIIASHPNVHGAGELIHLSQITSRKINTPQGLFTYPENINHLKPEGLHAIADEYLACLQAYAPGASHITDKMPGNFVLIGLIHSLFPNAKIIHVERNPIDTCLSCYTKRFSHGQAFSFDLKELGFYYASYQHLMSHWRKVLPANSWLDICYEDVVMNLETEAKRLIAYCDLEWNSDCLTFYRTKRHVRTASYTQIRNPIYTSSVDRWRRFENELKPLIQALNEGGTLFNKI
jgi:hypothetical protein